MVTKNGTAVDHPKHYNEHPSGVECIEIVEHFGFNVGNAIKYLWRADLKNGIEDLEKARWYCEREIQRRKAEAVKGAIDVTNDSLKFGPDMNLTLKTNSEPE